MKKRLRDILHDLGMVCLMGAVLDAALFLVFFVVLWLASGLAAMTALAYVRSALMITGALALFLCAGLLLFAKDTGLRSKRQWTTYFYRFDLLPVVLGGALSLLTLAVGLDYLLFAPG